MSTVSYLAVSTFKKPQTDEIINVSNAATTNETITCNGISRGIGHAECEPMTYSKTGNVWIWHTRMIGRRIISH